MFRSTATATNPTTICAGVIETIGAAAVRHPQTGRIELGNAHYECWRRLYPRALDFDAIIAQVTRWHGMDAFEQAEGFLTSLGRFVSREEAAAIAWTNQHVAASGPGALMSEDLWADAN
jgi:hypothetical protein